MTRISIVKLGLGASMLWALTGCAEFAFSGHGVNQGFIYAGTQANEHVTQNDLGAKKGEACSSSILGWITTGDSSVATAAKAGGITKVSSVDNTYSNILGIYASYCVNVTGS
jgi:hypothetical protein